MYLKNILVNQINIINQNIGIYLAIIYTLGHILIAMTCNRLLTGAPLNLAALDALIEPIINGFWFYILFEVVNKIKKNIHQNASGSNIGNIENNSLHPSKLAPINNKKNLD